MVKPLNDDNIDSIKSFLKESLEETRNSFNSDMKFNFEEYKFIRDTLQKTISILDEAIKNNQNLPELDSTINYLKEELEEKEELSDSFFDKLKLFTKKVYQKTERSKNFNGLLPALAVLAADAISPTLGKVTQSTINAFREK